MTETKLIKLKHYLPYAALLLSCGFGIWLMLVAGSRVYSERARTSSATDSQLANPTEPSRPSSASELPSTSNYLGRIFRDNLRNPVSILLLQLVVIIAATRMIGKVFQKIGQPAVLGEIVAGIVLGPSLLGWLSPQTMAFLFPAASMEILKLLSQIGVVLFMFIVGMELDIGQLRQKAHTAIMVSHASIIVPFFLGTALSFFLYPSLAPAKTTFTAFALFMGIAMSITAFPVLARILNDRGMSQTYLGTIALTCAAVDDVTAWCILALVIAIAATSSVVSALLTITLALVFILLMLLIVKPHLARRLTDPPHDHSRGFVAGILASLLFCSLITETIGIHALFGAFLAGVVIPPVPELRSLLKEKLETFSTAALMPLFFAFSGLRMQITLLNDWYSWLICAAVVAVAIAGKLGASMLMARWTGMNWRNSFSLGVLMNTRGLVELIVLNIGYDLGILSARSFAMLVLMALITTFMTGPLLALVNITGNRGRG